MNKDPKRFLQGDVFLKDISCETCCYWDKKTRPSGGQGECRGREPIAREDPEYPDFVYWVWPYTASEDWCTHHPYCNSHIKMLPKGVVKGEEDVPTDT
jgi:hypothetical protein